MKIAIGADHAGFVLKNELCEVVRALGHEVVDLGTSNASDRVDYPDFGYAVARAVAGGECQRGIAVCGSGIGISIAANRVAGARAALCTNSYMAKMARLHNDANVVCLGARITGPGMAEEIVRVFLSEAFEGGRHATRIAKL